MKTYKQFLNTPFSEEIAPPEPQEEDPGIKSKEKRQSQIKKMVLMKKLQAVRAGSGADIVASHTPEGDVLDELSKATLASYIKKGSEDAVKKMGDASRAGMSGRRKEADTGYDKAHKRVSGVRTAATKLQYKEEVVDEGIGRKIKVGMRLAKREAGRLVVDDPGGAETYGSLGNPKPGDKAKRDKERASKKKKVVEDKAFNFVLDKIKKEVGKDGYVSKNNPRKKQTDAEKAKVRAHQAKLAKQDGRDETEKASDMRYNDRSRSD